MRYDVIIIGNGPAGLSAALYTCRANLKTLVIGKDKGALEKVDKIENYFGMAAPVSGRELLENGMTQAKNLGAELLEEEVFDIAWNDGFTVICRQNTFEAKTVILATGSSRKSAKIKGLQELEGKGVSYCAICDAFFYRGKDIAVLGNGEYAVHEMSHLLPVVKSVTLITNGKKPEGDIPQQVQVKEMPVTEIIGQDYVEGVVFDNGERIETSGIFVALGSAGAVDLARKLGAEVAGASIVVNEKMETNVPGLFAAGDCIGGLLQIASAVGEGAQAAMSAMKFARKQ